MVRGRERGKRIEEDAERSIIAVERRRAKARGVEEVAEKRDAERRGEERRYR